MPEDRDKIVTDLAINAINRIAQILHDAVDLVENKDEIVMLMTMVAVTVGDQYLSGLEHYVPETGVSELSEKGKTIALYSMLTKISCDLPGKYAVPFDELADISSVSGALYREIERARDAVSLPSTVVVMAEAKKKRGKKQ